MVGVPIAGLSASTNASFTIDYGYLTLDCPSLWNGSPNDPELLKNLGYIYSPDGLAFQSYPNATRDGPLLYTTSTGDWVPFFLDTNTNFSIYEQYNGSSYLPDQNLIFGSVRYNPYAGEGYWSSVRNCTVQNRYVEAKIGCNGLECSTKALRPSSAYSQLNPALTMLCNPTIFGHLAFDLSLSFAGATHPTRGASSATELFIEGIDPYGDFTAFQNDSGTDIIVMANLSSKVFARRLSIVLNTFMNLASAPGSFAGNLPAPSVSAWGPYGNGSINYTAVAQGDYSQVVSPFFAHNATATLSTLHEIYVCNWLWFAIYLSSTLLLIVVTLCGTILKHMCLGPDMFGYVSSMTYDSALFGLPPGGTLDGMDRARLLKDMRCRVGAVDGTRGPHVVFAAESAPYATSAVVALKRKMKYV